MIFTFRLISNEQENFVRDFEIKHDQTFYDLHVAIQENLHYDKSQIASFFICNEKWEKEQEITLFELSEEEASRVIVMDAAHIGEFIKEKKQKLLYVFDVFNERSFYIEVADIHKKDQNLKYPVCTHAKGSAPQQIIMDQIFMNKNLSENFEISEPPLDDEYLDEGNFDDYGFDDNSSDDD